MAIAEWISGVWAETERMLQAKPTVAYESKRELAIQSAIAELYAAAAPGVAVPPPSELDTADPLIQELIAWISVQRLIPLAKDVYMQDPLSTNESYQPGGSGGVSYYNKAQALDVLAEQLTTWIAARQPLVIKLIRAMVGTVPTPRPRLPFFALARGERGR